MVRDDYRERPGATEGLRAGEILSRAWSHVRRDPWLLVPFVLVGGVLTLADWLHRSDPIPAFEREPITANGIDVQLEFVGYPTGVGQTERALESLIGLELPYLLWGIGLEVLTLLAVSLAGATAIARTIDAEADTVTVLRLFGFVAGVELLFRGVGAIDVLQGMGVFGIVLLVLVLHLFVRLFAAPGYIVAGHPVGEAIRRSNRHVRGRGWTVFGLVLAFGLGAWLLGAVPHLGTVLSAALVASLHAVAIGVLLDQG